MTSENIPRLKLLAKDIQDLNVFSAYLQDSVIVANDIKFLLKTKKLICVFNRFMWEDAEKGIFRKNKRIRSALVFDNVLRVKSKGINPKKKTKILEFLAIKTEIKDNYFDIRLIFCGDNILLVKTEEIDSSLEDFGKTWETSYKPKHKI
ncbi:MAG: DUF2948 family protein [Candidatus Fonsibacter sp.]|nr:DUF2948 family protein [Candidatus Fonsibacter sp.]